MCESICAANFGPASTRAWGRSRPSRTPRGTVPSSSSPRSGEWSLVEPLFGYIDQLPGGWSSLDGNVVAAGAAGSVTNLSIGPGEVAPAPADEGISRTTWLAVGAGCVVLAGLVIGALLWSRRRRGAAEPVAPAPPVQ